MGKKGWEHLYWLVELDSKGEVGERGGKVVHWLVEICIEGEVGERGRERRD